jgi:hypothetical protein
MTKGDDWRTDEELADWRAMSPEQHIVSHLGHEMMSMYALVEYAADESSLPFDAMAGCREAFYMHARTVAEFFVLMPRKDWTARDFVPDWTPPSELAGRLRRVWVVATKSIAHMSRQRVPDLETFNPEDTSQEGLTRIAIDCFQVMAAFVARYQQETNHEHAQEMAAYLRGRITEQWVADYHTFPPYRPN